MTIRFLRDASIFSLISFGEKGIAVITFPLLASQLEPAEYGLFDLTILTVSITVLAAGLELYQGTLRYLAAAGSTEAKTLILSTALTSVIVVGTVVCGISLLVVPVAGKLVFGSSGHENLLYWGAALVLSTVISALLQVAARAQLKTKLLVWAALARLTIQTGLVLALVFGAGWRAEALVAAQIAGSITLSIMCLIGCGDVIKFIWDRETFVKLISFSGPLLASSLCVVLSQQADRIIVRGLLGLDSVGILGAGYRVASLVSLLTSGIVMALSPLIYQMYAEPETPMKIARILRYYLATCLLLCLMLVVFSNFLIMRLTPPEYHEASLLVPILGGVLMIAQIPTFFPGLALAGRSGSIALAQITGLLVNFGLMTLLGLRFGLTGICLSNVIAQIFVIGIIATLGQRHYLIAIPWRAIAASILIPSCAIWLWDRHLPHTIWSGAGLLGICLALILAMGMIKYHELELAVSMLRNRLKRLTGS